MNKIAAYFGRHRWHYIVLVCVMSLFTFGTYLAFTFWKDDWQLLWAATYNFSVMHQYWVHPATVVEFMWLTKLFGQHVVLWQLFGIGLHVGVAVVISAFAVEVTESLFVGFLSGIFYSTTVIGMDSVGWPSAHVVLISAVLLLTGMIYLIRYVRTQKDTWLILASLYTGIGIICDPFRNFPIIFMVPAIGLIVTLSQQRQKSFVRFLEVLVLAFVSVSIFAFGVFTKDILGSQFFKHLLAIHGSADVLRKLYVVGNYFNSLANMLFGWIIRFPEDASTGVYNRFMARMGFFMTAVVGGIGFRYLKTKSKKLGIVVYLFLWMALFYIPNWLFEPRLTMGVTHRYMTLSGLGCIVLVAYLVSLIKGATVRMLLTVIFIVCNIGTARYYLSIASTYRSASKVNALWQNIVHDAPRGDHLIFMFEGDDPVKTYSLALSGSAPYALVRHITDVYNFPIVTGDRSLIQQLICSENVPRTEPGSMTMQKDVIPLNHVFAWRVTRDGALTDISLPVRKSFVISSLDANCVPTVDRAMIAGSK